MKPFIPIVIALLLFGCTQDGPEPARDNTVHMAGFITTSALGPVASYWKDGAYTKLVSDSAYSNANALFVHAGTAMISGYNIVPSAFHEVFIWRNGTRSIVDDAWGDGPFIAANNNNVFAVWRSKSSTGWVLNKNGISQPLVDSGNDSWPTSLALLGDDVYISGVVQGHEFSSDTAPYYSDQYAQFWKNDQPIFKEINRSFAWSIFVHQNDIYLGGNLYPYPAPNRIACYWKNGKRVDLTDGSQDAAVSSIFVTDTNVYASGTIGGHACYWKDGVITMLPHGVIRSGGNSIFVNGADIHIAGYDDGYPAYWKNDVKQTFDNQNKRGELRFIVVGGS